MPEKSVEAADGLEEQLSQIVRVEEMTLDQRSDKFDMLWSLIDVRKQAFRLHDQSLYTDEGIDTDYWGSIISQVDSIIDSVSGHFDEDAPYGY